MTEDKPLPCVLGPIAKDLLAVDIWIYFWCLHSVPLTYISAFFKISVSYCFDYYSFEVCFEIRWCDISSFDLPLQDFYDCCGFMGLHLNFRVVCPIYKKVIVILVEITLKR